MSPLWALLKWEHLVALGVDTLLVINIGRRARVAAWGALVQPCPEGCRDRAGMPGLEWAAGISGKAAGVSRKAGVGSWVRAQFGLWGQNSLRSPLLLPPGQIFCFLKPQISAEDGGRVNQIFLHFSEPHPCSCWELVQGWCQTSACPGGWLGKVTDLCSSTSWCGLCVGDSVCTPRQPLPNPKLTQVVLCCHSLMGIMSQILLGKAELKAHGLGAVKHWWLNPSGFGEVKPLPQLRQPH